MIMFNGTTKEVIRPLLRHYGKMQYVALQVMEHDMIDDCNSNRSTNDIKTSIII
jgi:hypothetical protein